MEISDEKLRQIVRETLRELGDEAAPELVRKVVREVVRRLQQKEAPVLRALIPRSESPAPPSIEKSDGSSPGY